MQFLHSKMCFLQKQLLLLYLECTEKKVSEEWEQNYRKLYSSVGGTKCYVCRVKCCSASVHFKVTIEMYTCTTVLSMNLQLMHYYLQVNKVCHDPNNFRIYWYIIWLTCLIVLANNLVLILPSQFYNFVVLSRTFPLLHSVVGRRCV